MSAVRFVVYGAKLLWRGTTGVKAFFVKWFLPAPAVESLNDHDRWAFYDDEDSGDKKELPGRDGEHDSAQIAAPRAPAPEVHSPEGAEERQARQPNMPNPFA